MQGLIETFPRTIMILFLFYLVCKAMDFILGILKTWKNPGTYKSRIMRDGIIRWVAELVAITFVIGLDIVLGLNYILLTPVLGLFIYKEAGSIVENLRDCGVELPNVILNHLSDFNPNKEDNKNAKL